METSSQVGRIVLVKKGELLPENAIRLTDLEVLNMQKERIENFNPQKEMKVFKYGKYLVGASVAVSGAVLHNAFRKRFQLGGLKVLFTYVVSTVLPSAFSVVIHEAGIRDRILIGSEPCPTCVAVRSGIFQFGLGFIYPYILSVLTCFPLALEYSTLPAAQKGFGYLSLLFQVSPPSNTLLTLVVFNVFTGMLISSKEMQVYLKHLSKPPAPLNTVNNDISERVLE